MRFPSMWGLQVPRVPRYERFPIMWGPQLSRVLSSGMRGPQVSRFTRFEGSPGMRVPTTKKFSKLVVRVVWD